MLSLQSLDAFPKIERNIQHATRVGGLLTLLVGLGLSFLIYSELSQYLKVKQDYEFLVDQGGVSKIQINIDLTVAMECQYLRYDVLDLAGTNLNLHNKFSATPTTFTTKGARIFTGQKEGKLKVHNIVQHAESRDWFDRTAKGIDSCRIRGTAEVNKVSGMLHFTALGHGHIDSQHVPHDALNFTHRVDKLSFGRHYPGLINPLDHSIELANSTFEIFQYFVSVVPTIFVDKLGTFGSKIILTNQYAVTDHQRTIQNALGVPGIFIKYDIEPIEVRVTESRTGFMHYLTRLCGIVGGIYVSVGLLNNLLQFIQKFLSES